MTENQNDLITITAGELMDRQFLPRHTVVENFLPAGTFILSGQPKIGKSFLMLMLCWCVSEGKPFLGFETRQSEVLYLTLEDTDARIQERLARMFGTDWDGVKLHLPFRTTLSGNDLIQQLQNFVFDHPETRLIVIDTLYLAREGGDGTAYSYSSDYKDIRPFKLFTDAYHLFTRHIILSPLYPGVFLLRAAFRLFFHQGCRCDHRQHGLRHHAGIGAHRNDIHQPRKAADNARALYHPLVGLEEGQQSHQRCQNRQQRHWRFVG